MKILGALFLGWVAFVDILFYHFLFHSSWVDLIVALSSLMNMILFLRILFKIEENKRLVWKNYFWAVGFSGIPPLNFLTTMMTIYEMLHRFLRKIRKH